MRHRSFSFLLYFVVGLVSYSLYSCEGTLELNTESPFKVEPEVIAYTKLMTMTSKSPHPQGGDCWGDLFFQFVTGNSKVKIYDLSIGALVQTVSIPSNQRGFVPKCHCNTVCFGSEYYDENDSFPLIYVSTGYASDGYTGALVYRIITNQGKYSFELVQVIRFPEDKSSWTEFIPAGQFGYLCYPSERIIFKVPLPKLIEEDVIIDRTNAIATYQFSPQPKWMFSSRNQDRIYYQGKIIFPSGVPNAHEALVLVVLNLEKQVRERIIDFTKMGLTSEPESIFIWNGDL